MGETTTLTIRIDEDLKALLEQAAAASDRSVTEFVIRAVKAKMAPQCTACGRTDLPVQQAGLTPEFREFLDDIEHKKQCPPMTIATIEGQQRIAYWGRLQFGRPKEGFIPCVVDGPRGARAEIVIPRAVVIGWAHDPKGDYAQTLVRSGYVDGSAWALANAKTTRS